MVARTETGRETRSDRAGPGRDGTVNGRVRTLARGCGSVLGHHGLLAAAAPCGRLSLSTSAEKCIHHTHHTVYPDGCWWCLLCCWCPLWATKEPSTMMFWVQLCSTNRFRLGKQTNKNLSVADLFSSVMRMWMNSDLKRKKKNKQSLQDYYNRMV